LYNGDGDDRECDAELGDCPFPLQYPAFFEKSLFGAGHTFKDPPAN